MAQTTAMASIGYIGGSYDKIKKHRKEWKREKEEKEEGKTGRPRLARDWLETTKAPRDYEGARLA
jgi:hypothetical protein